MARAKLNEIEIEIETGRREAKAVEGSNRPLSYSHGRQDAIITCSRASGLINRATSEMTEESRADENG